MSFRVTAELLCMAEIRYAVVLEPCPPDEGGGYTVTVPALPEIVTEGDDLAHALEMARDAIALSLRCRQDAGMETPLSDAEGARLEIVAVAAA
ncbi:MAG: type II toxin-antitoxin system HicB family antitoxin [Vulcanimicrobiaceae bacterium]